MEEVICHLVDDLEVTWQLKFLGYAIGAWMGFTTVAAIKYIFGD